MRLIGDIHGDLKFYKEAIKGSIESIQVGDFGVGFVPTQELLDLDERQPYHRFLRGNHDNPEFCEQLIRNIPSGTIDNGCFFLGGAWSIDYRSRTPGFSWWEEEQHTHRELGVLLDKYLQHRPHTVITHDCPTLVAYELFLKGTLSPLFLNRTGEALQRMFEQHQPERWYFGHWHRSATKRIEGTTFTCLGINEVLDIRW